MDKLKQGNHIKCIIRGTEIKDAIIVIEGINIYACQNIEQGSAPLNRYGYKYGYCLGYTTEINHIIEKHDVQIIQTNQQTWNISNKGKEFNFKQ